MASYRIFFLNKYGRIFSHRDIEAVDDEDAIEKVKKIKAPHEIELWKQSDIIWRGIPQRILVDEIPLHRI